MLELNPTDWNDLARRLAGSLEEPQSSPQLVQSREELEARLAAIVLELLQHRFEQLAQLMYRLDVPEARFNETLRAPTLPLAAEAIARLMVDREIIRLEMRRRFSK